MRRKSSASVAVWVSLVFGAIAGPDVRADMARVVPQATSSDCGPAALATLLTYYLDLPAREAEIARLAGADHNKGTSLQGLETATAAKGLGAASYRMDFATLEDQLRLYKCPVLVRILLPEPHFVLVLAADNASVTIADPATGNSKMRRTSFCRRWLSAGTAGQLTQGYVMLVARADGKTDEENLRLTLERVEKAEQNLRTAGFKAAFVPR